MDSPRPIGFWLKLVDNLIDQQLAVTLEEHGVTRRQWQLLNVLTRQPSTTAELDEAVAPFLSADDNESSTEHLAELVDSDWVVETVGSYTLTERGSAAFERLSEVVAEQRTLVAAGIEPDEYEGTASVLERMARNLGWSEI